MRHVYLPRTLEHLWDILDREPDAALYAGGTDLLVNMGHGVVDPPSLICLERIDPMRGVSDHGDRVHLGAATTHTQLLEDRIVRDNFPVLTAALRVLASPPIRNMGTIGGNIVNASPAGDTLPPLYVMGAEVEIRSRDASRTVRLSDFIRGPGEVLLQKGEVVTGVWIEKAPDYNVHHYEKVGRRKSQACSVAGMAALLRVSQADIIEDVRLAWGSVGPTVVTSPEVERMLTGEPLSPEALRRAVPLVEAAVSPIDDIRAGADYRRAVSGNLLLRLVQYSNQAKTVERNIDVG